MKKLVVLAALAYGAYWYASRHYRFDQTLAYAKKNTGKSWAPAAEYYTGLVYLHRAEFPKAQEAFTQLLTDHATSQYAPKALLRQSEAAMENRDWETAKLAADQFLRDYPDHPGARLMEKRKETLYNK